VVTATLRQVGIAIGPGTAVDTSEGFPPTYYPGTANPAEAQAVTVSLGQELSLQLTLVAARMARVSGTVVGSDGRPAAGAMVLMRSGTGAAAMMTMLNGRVAPDGSFNVTNVPPGEHIIDIRPQPRGPNTPIEFASLPVTVANEDISGLRITTGGGATARGRVIFEGSAPRTGGFGPLTVFAQSSDPQQFMGAVMMGGPTMNNGTVGDDGSFILDGISGSVLFRAATPPAWTLKSVTIDGEDVTDVPLDTNGVRTIPDVRVVLTDRLTEIAGGVTNDRGNAVKEFVVIILPEEMKTGSAAMRYIRTVRPDQDGRFRVRGLPPGAYLVAASASLEQGQEWDPEVQARLRDVARRMSLTEGQSVALDLRLTSL
jgi:hypothetical protein